jgi:protocatechuate 4,5-dioxygenase alpha chain
MTSIETDLESPVFDGRAAQRGYPLNAMCYSFNDAANRARFLADPEAYFREFELDEAQRRAVRERDILAMIAAGGNAYYLLKLANLLGMDVQDVGAQQSGLSRRDFQARLQANGG